MSIWRQDRTWDAANAIALHVNKEPERRQGQSLPAYRDHALKLFDNNYNIKAIVKHVARRGDVKEARQVLEIIAASGVLKEGIADLVHSLLSRTYDSWDALMGALDFCEILAAHRRVSTEPAIRLGVHSSWGCYPGYLGEIPGNRSEQEKSKLAERCV